MSVFEDNGRTNYVICKEIVYSAIVPRGPRYVSDVAAVNTLIDRLVDRAGQNPRFVVIRTQEPDDLYVFQGDLTAFCVVVLLCLFPRYKPALLKPNVSMIKPNGTYIHCCE